MRVGRWCLLALALSGAAQMDRAEGPAPFETTGHADHPWVGRIWSSAEAAWIEAGVLDRRLAAARFLLLGEVHDHPDHHRHQARFLAARAGGPERPAVVFEMLERARQPEIDAFLAGPERSPEAFAKRVDWASSGWPDFALYRPIFAVALVPPLPILAAGLPLHDPVPPGPAERQRFGIDRPLPPDQQEAWLDEMFEGHCKLMPRDQLGPMVEFQRARDARMAGALLRGGGEDGSAVLIAGNGHVRWGGVPSLLVHAGVPREAVLAVGLLEVDPAASEPGETQASRFDVAIFTPAAEREDPCEGLRRRLEPGVTAR